MEPASARSAPFGLGLPRDVAARVRCIAFDAVGTLIYPDPPVARVYFEAGSRHGSQLAETEVDRRFKAVFRQTERNGADVGSALADVATSEDLERERWQQIVRDVFHDVADQEICFAELFTHFAQASSWKLFSDVSQTLRSLSAAGYGLAIASNFDHRLNGVCDGFEELRTVRCRTISAEAGFRKPSPKFYQALLAAMDCRPEELLMIGDDWENDVLGARAAGLPALLIQRRTPHLPGQLKSLLELMA